MSQRAGGRNIWTKGAIRTKIKIENVVVNTRGLNFLGELSSERGGYETGCLEDLQRVNQNASMHIISPRNIPIKTFSIKPVLMEGDNGIYELESVIVQYTRIGTPYQQY